MTFYLIFGFIFSIFSVLFIIAAAPSIDKRNEETSRLLDEHREEFNRKCDEMVDSPRYRNATKEEKDKMGKELLNQSEKEMWEIVNRPYWKRRKD